MTTMEAISNIDLDNNSLSLKEKFYRDVYLEPDLSFRNNIGNYIGPAFSQISQTLLKTGIVALHNVFTQEQVATMQNEFSSLVTLKELDNHAHIQFGGAADEEYLFQSVMLSAALSSPVIWAIGAYAWGKDPALSFSRLYRIEPFPPKLYRAFQPHDDGHDIEYKVMILLSNVPPNGQAMKYWPGSHLLKREIISSQDTLVSHETTQKLGKEFLCAGPAGTIFIFNTKGIHAGQRNLSMRRDTLVFNITGGKRLYPVPRLSSRVSDKLDPYRKEVLRVGKEKLLNEIEGENPQRIDSNKLLQFLSIHHKEIEEQCRQNILFNNKISLSKSLLELRRLHSKKRPLPTFFKEKIPSFLSDKIHKELKDVLPKYLREDVNRGIDLPLRPYSGTRDRLRDMALCYIRDIRAQSISNNNLFNNLVLKKFFPFSNYVLLYKKIPYLFITLAKKHIMSSHGEYQTMVVNQSLLASDLFYCINTAQSHSLLRTPLALFVGSADYLLENVARDNKKLYSLTLKFYKQILMTYAYFVYLSITNNSAASESFDLRDTLEELK
jgi:Phytanoyl-CoA dioxygenase (PhyH)